MVHLITGYKGVEHIQSEDTRSYNRAMFGSGQFVMEVGNKLNASIVSNNVVRVLDGDVLMQGGHIRIEPDTYEDMTHDVGSVGMTRIDLIVLTYEKNEVDTTETAYLEIVKGEETAGTPVEPTLITGDISAGALKNQMLLYKVPINVYPTMVIKAFEEIPSYKTLAEQAIEQYETDLEAIRGSDFFETIEEIVANEQTGKFTGALATKELVESLDNVVLGVDDPSEVDDPVTMVDVYSDDTIVVSRTGNTVTINFVGANWLNVTTLELPDQFIPYKQFSGVIYVVDPNSTSRFVGLANIKDDGTIGGSRISTSGTNTSMDNSYNVYGSISYPVQLFEE